MDTVLCAYCTSLYTRESLTPWDSTSLTLTYVGRKLKNLQNHNIIKHRFLYSTKHSNCSVDKLKTHVFKKDKRVICVTETTLLILSILNLLSFTSIIQLSCSEAYVNIRFRWDTLKIKSTVQHRIYTFWNYMSTFVLKEYVHRSKAVTRLK